MPSVLDTGPFSQPEWSDSSDSLEPTPLPQLGYFVPVRCRSCMCERTSTRHVCRRSRRESPRSRRSVSQCSCNSVSRRSSAAASPLPMQLPALNNTMEMYVEPVVEDSHQFGSYKNIDVDLQATPSIRPGKKT
ncbi:Prophage CP4-57 integrase [Operophtera brumata]|uniref:Prophage CP4-57 integrase n=1 Tax=Operophtera brumata TaxID=104452 RepID=A0A0L7LT45_OPEBR|nr:Prophage CP4-57 integrase [Operophtera brumata]